MIEISGRYHTSVLEENSSIHEKWGSFINGRVEMRERERESEGEWKGLEKGQGSKKCNQIIISKKTQQRK